MKKNTNAHLDHRSLPKGKYRHYKGGEYEVLGTVYHSETEELMVLYRPCYGDAALWVRPFDMFNELLSFEGCVASRFKLIEEYKN